MKVKVKWNDIIYTINRVMTGQRDDYYELEAEPIDEVEWIDKLSDHFKQSGDKYLSPKVSIDTLGAFIRTEIIKKMVRDIKDEWLKNQNDHTTTMEDDIDAVLKRWMGGGR